MFNKTLLAVGISLIFAGCANINSISRTTSLPGGGLAVHMDAKQRAIIAKDFGAVCAEPSPDALSAYASSLGAGLAVPSKGSASIAQALTETSASIGLRTQSITLMRDALYRICEAYYSKAINGAQVAALLARSQDLSLAVLAVEQLTGTVAARQVGLAGTSGATASSNLAHLQSLLDNVRNDEQRKIDALKVANDDRDAKKAALEEKKTALSSATTSGASAEEIQKLGSERDAASNAWIAADQAAKQADAVAKEATKTRETIEKNYQTALTSANATASGSVSFANALQPVTLDQKTTEAIATNVKEIVNKVIGKSYLVEGCFALVSRNRPDKMTTEEQALYDEGIRGCNAIIKSALAVPNP